MPTRYYLNRTEVNFTHLAPTSTITACPYKGITSGYWTARIGKAGYPDIAWTYDFPSRHCSRSRVWLPSTTRRSTSPWTVSR